MRITRKFPPLTSGLSVVVIFGFALSFKIIYSKSDEPLPDVVSIRQKYQSPTLAARILTVGNEFSDQISIIDAVEEDLTHLSLGSREDDTDKEEEEIIINAITDDTIVSRNIDDNSVGDFEPFFTTSELMFWRINIKDYIEGKRKPQKGPFQGLVTELTKRLARTKQLCSEGIVYSSVNDSRKHLIIENIPDHNILYCPIAKVGSNYVRGNLRMLDMLYHSTKFMPAYRDHGKLTLSNHEVRVVNMNEQLLEGLDQKLMFTTVRHPIQRVFSAYCNKVLQRGFTMGYKFLQFPIDKEPLDIVKDLLPEYRLPSNYDGETKTNFSDESKSFFIRSVNYSLPKTIIEPEAGIAKPKPGRPTFPQFVLWVAVSILQCKKDRKCLMKINPHMVPEAVRCDPCRLKLDAILKLESLTEEFSLFRKFFHIPELDEELIQYKIKQETHMKIVSEDDDNDEELKTMKLNESASLCAPYEYFMAQLSQLHLDLLYTAYYVDLQMYGYEFGE